MSATRQIVRGACPLDCPDTCSMLVTVEGDRAVAVRANPGHAMTHGVLCHKVSRYLERVYHPGRVATPLKRVGPKGRGEFVRISWDEALTEIARRYAEIAGSSAGPQAILPYSYCGTMGKIQGESLDRRFFHRLGASLLDRTICASAGAAGYAYTIGQRVGTDPEEVANSRYIVNWGSNTAVTNSHLWIRMVEARKRGAKIVTIDPYRCRTAERSDWHLRPRVGTDAALALGVMHVLFRHGLVDRDYLERYCLGVEPLRDRVLTDWSPAQTSAVCGLPADDIIRFANEYAANVPAMIRVNYGLQRHAGGGMAVRTIACLPALVGAWRHPAGGCLLSTSSAFALNARGLQRPDLSPPGTRTVNMNQLAEALHGELPGPPVQALYVYNGNPAAVAPDQKRVLDGLRREELFTVVHEQFLTDTADYADLVLPATTQLEHFDLHTTYGHYDIQVNSPSIPPFAEARCNTDVFRGLADRLGFERNLFQVTDRDLVRTALWEDPAQPGSQVAEVPLTLQGITLDRLLESGPLRLHLPKPYVPFAEGEFRTPSGKCEFWSQQLADLGHDPLPTYIPPAESPESQPELAAKYPLQLLTPPTPHFMNSSFVELESLRKAAREPELEIHPDDAAPRGIQTGQPVRVRNDRGTFQAAAVVGETVRPGVVVATGIWWHKLTAGVGNANLTTSTRLSDLAGGATFFDNLVEVEPISASIRL